MSDFTMLTVVLEEGGFERAMRGLSFNKEQTHRSPEEMLRVASKLVEQGEGHGKFSESIVVWMEVTAPRYIWQEFDTYRVGMTKQSESTMFRKSAISKNDFEAGSVTDEYIKELNDIFDSGNKLKFKQKLQESYLQKRLCCTNYKTLRNMIKQRYNHGMPHWQSFCVSVLEQVKHPELIMADWRMVCEICKVKLLRLSVGDNSEKK